MSHPQAEKKTKPIRCVVTSDKMDKSRVAVKEYKVKHSTYFKYIKRRTKIMFHDETNQTKVGDEVLVTPSRPRSTRKCFQLVKVLSSAK